MPQCTDILTFIGDKGNWIHCSTSIWYYHFKSPYKIRPRVSHVLPFSILTLQFVHRSEIYSSTSLPSSKLISASIRLHNALWFHSVAVQTAVSTEKNECLWEMHVYRICPDVCLCQNVAPVFPCTQTFYQTCDDGLGFVLSTRQMICDWGWLRAPNMLMLQQRQSLSDLFRIYSIYLSITRRALFPHHYDFSC